MLELLQHRRSIRTFTDEPVSQENIDSLLKAALLAPSSMGKNPSNASSFGTRKP